MLECICHTSLRSCWELSKIEAKVLMLKNLAWLAQFSELVPRQCHPGRCQQVCTSSGGRPHFWARSLIQHSATIIPWGPPKPRKAVLEGKLVLQTMPMLLTLGMLYELSKCNRALSITWWRKGMEVDTLYINWMSDFSPMPKPDWKLIYNNQHFL